jgi:RNase P/RNase MRP subunit p30
MKKFTDLNTNLENSELIDFISQLGFSRIAYKKKIENKKIDIVSSLNIKPRNIGSLLKEIETNRTKYEFISVTSTSKNVARKAGRDHRIDGIKFPINSKVSFDYHQANLMKKSGSALQIDIVDLLERGSFKLEKNIQTIHKQVRVAAKNDIPIILSSGAYEKYQLRTPRGIIALASMIKIDEDSATDSLSEIPNTIIDRNRSKLSDKFVSSGVWLV